jgi:neutral ceramidase
MSMALDPVCLAGWASASITPEVPCWMAGYAARSSPANAVHDPLEVHALALGTPSKALIVVVCDLLAVDEQLVEAVRQRVQAERPGASVWLSATHTHSGPDIGGPLSEHPPAPGIRESIVAGATRAALSAMAALRPVRESWVSGEVRGVATNRDHPEAGEELTLDLLCLVEADSRESTPPIAVFGSFPCHPTVLGASNLDISADLSGAFRRQLRAALGQNTWVALATGAGGDISTRHTRRAQDFVELERLGGLLAEHARSLLLAGARPIQILPLALGNQSVALELKASLSGDAADVAQTSLTARRAELLRTGQTAEARTVETMLQGLARAGRAHAATEPHLLATISVAGLGELDLVALPGEPYHQLGVEISRDRGGPVLVLGYTNGYIGYIPTREAYADFDYEILVSLLAPGGGERLRDAATQLLASSIGGST